MERTHFELTKYPLTVALPAACLADARLVALAHRLEKENAEARHRLFLAQPRQVRFDAPPSAPSRGLAMAGRALWLAALGAGATVLGVVSHMGSDSRRGAYSVISVEELQTTGVWTVLLWLGVLAAVGLASWAERGLRPRALNVTVLVTALMASGLFWAIVATVAEQAMGFERFGVLTSLGSFLGLVLWLRLLALGFRGALFGRA